MPKQMKYYPELDHDDIVMLQSMINGEIQGYNSMPDSKRWKGEKEKHKAILKLKSKCSWRNLKRKEAPHA